MSFKGISVSKFVASMEITFVRWFAHVSSVVVCTAAKPCVMLEIAIVATRFRSTSCAVIAALKLLTRLCLVVIFLIFNSVFYIR